MRSLKLMLKKKAQHSVNMNKVEQISYTKVKIT